jgi:type IV secretory pathway VirB6-like protein
VFANSANCSWSLAKNYDDNDNLTIKACLTATTISNAAGENFDFDSLLDDPATDGEDYSTSDKCDIYGEGKSNGSTSGQRTVFSKCVTYCQGQCEKNASPDEGIWVRPLLTDPDSVGAVGVVVADGAVITMKATGSLYLKDDETTGGLNVTTRGAEHRTTSSYTPGTKIDLVLGLKGINSSNNTVKIAASGTDPIANHSRNVFLHFPPKNDTMVPSLELSSLTCKFASYTTETLSEKYLQYPHLRAAYCSRSYACANDDTTCGVFSVSCDNKYSNFFNGCQNPEKLHSFATTILEAEYSVGKVGGFVFTRGGFSYYEYAGNVTNFIKRGTSDNLITKVSAGAGSAEPTATKIATADISDFDGSNKNKAISFKAPGEDSVSWTDSYFWGDSSAASFSFSIEKPMKLALKLNITGATTCAFTIKEKNSASDASPTSYSVTGVSKKWSVVQQTSGNVTSDVVFNKFSTVVLGARKIIEISTSTAACKGLLLVKLLPLAEVEVKKTGMLFFAIPGHETSSTVKFNILNPRALSAPSVSAADRTGAFYEKSGESGDFFTATLISTQADLIKIDTNNYESLLGGSTTYGFFVREGQVLRFDYTNWISALSGTSETITNTSRTVSKNDWVSSDSVAIASVHYGMDLSFVIKERKNLMCFDNGQEVIDLQEYCTTYVQGTYSEVGDEQSKTVGCLVEDTSFDTACTFTAAEVNQLYAVGANDAKTECGITSPMTTTEPMKIEDFVLKLYNLYYTLVPSDITAPIISANTPITTCFNTVLKLALKRTYDCIEYLKDKGTFYHVNTTFSCNDDTKKSVIDEDGGSSNILSPNEAYMYLLAWSTGTAPTSSDNTLNCKMCGFSLTEGTLTEVSTTTLNGYLTTMVSDGLVGTNGAELTPSTTNICGDSGTKILYKGTRPTTTGSSISGLLSGTVNAITLSEEQEEQYEDADNPPSPVDGFKAVAATTFFSTEPASAYGCHKGIRTLAKIFAIKPQTCSDSKQADMLPNAKYSTSRTFNYYTRYFSKTGCEALAGTDGQCLMKNVSVCYDLTNYIGDMGSFISNTTVSSGDSRLINTASDDTAEKVLPKANNISQYGFLTANYRPSAFGAEKLNKFNGSSGLATNFILADTSNKYESDSGDASVEFLKTKYSERIEASESSYIGVIYLKIKPSTVTNYSTFNKNYVKGDSVSSKTIAKISTTEKTIFRNGSRLSVVFSKDNLAPSGNDAGLGSTGCQYWVTSFDNPPKMTKYRWDSNGNLYNLETGAKEIYVSKDESLRKVILGTGTADSEKNCGSGQKNMYFNIIDVDTKVANNSGKYAVKIISFIEGEESKIVKKFSEFFNSFFTFLDGMRLNLYTEPNGTPVSCGVNAGADSCNDCEEFQNQQLGGLCNKCVIYDPSNPLNNGLPCTRSQSLADSSFKAICIKSCAGVNRAKPTVWTEGKCMKFSDGSGFVAAIYKGFTKNPLYQFIVKVSLVLMLSLYGFNYFLGKSDFKAETLIYKIIRVCCIYFLIGEKGWEFFDSVVIGLFKDGIDSLLFTVASAFETDFDSKLLVAVANQDFSNKVLLFQSGLDNLSMLFSEQLTAKILGLLFSSLFGLVYVYLLLMAMISYIIAIFTSMILYLNAQLYMTIIFSLFPIVILFMMFDKTKKTLENWFFMLLGFVFQEIFLVLSLSFFNSIVRVMIKSVFAYRVCWQTIFSFKFAGLLSVPIFFWKVPSSSVVAMPTSFNAQGYPNFYSILTFYIFGTLMGKFITGMVDTASTLVGGSHKITGGIAGKVNAKMERAKETVSGFLKDTGGTFVSQMAKRSGLDQSDYNKGKQKEAEKEKKLKKESRESARKTAFDKTAAFDGSDEQKRQMEIEAKEKHGKSFDSLSKDEQGKIKEKVNENEFNRTYRDAYAEKRSQTDDKFLKKMGSSREEYDKMDEKEKKDFHRKAANYLENCGEVSGYKKYGAESSARMKSEEGASSVARRDGSALGHDDQSGTGDTPPATPSLDGAGAGGSTAPAAPSLGGTGTGGTPPATPSFGADRSGDQDDSHRSGGGGLLGAVAADVISSFGVGDDTQQKETVARDPERGEGSDTPASESSSGGTSGQSGGNDAAAAAPSVANDEISPAAPSPSLSPSVQNINDSEASKKKEESEKKEGIGKKEGTEKKEEAEGGEGSGKESKQEESAIKRKDVMGDVAKEEIVKLQGTIKELEERAKNLQGPEKEKEKDDLLNQVKELTQQIKDIEIRKPSDNLGRVVADTGLPVDSHKGKEAAFESYRKEGDERRRSGRGDIEKMVPERFSGVEQKEINKPAKETRPDSQKEEVREETIVEIEEVKQEGTVTKIDGGEKPEGV